MLQWMLMPLRRYAEFSGRSRRMEYWSFFLFSMVVAAALFAVVLGTGSGSAAMADMMAGNPSAVVALFSSGLGVVFLIYFAAILVPSIAVAVRRLHDRDLSGWWYLGYIVASMIPYLSFVAGIVFLVLMCMPGTPGPNRFGPDPKNPANVEVFG